MDKYLKKITIAFWIVAIIGTLTWSLTMVKSGLVYSFGMGFWGPNGHDGVWHIALAESLAKGSWPMPVFAGETIKNYHIGFDLILAIIHKLTFIPPLNLYFQIIPPILALGIGLSVYWFVLTWKKSKPAAFWATFFVYFGGSFGWIITLLRNREIGGESLFWAQQSISTLINPPFALSLILMFSGLTLLIKGTRAEDKKRLILATFIFGVLVQIKVYAGLLSLGALFISGIFRMARKRKIDVIKVFAGALVVSILLFSPLGRGIENTIIFKPFWFLETMMGFADRLNWQRFYSAMVNYRLGGVWLKGILAYFAAFLIFLIGNMGTRIVGLGLVVGGWWRRRLTSIDVFIFAVIIAGIVIPMFYIQSGTAWNTLQFFYYALAFSGLMTGIWLGEFIKDKSTAMTRIIVVVFVVLFTLPTTVGTLRQYLPARPPAKISHEELAALDFLSRQPAGVVLTLPFDRDAAEKALDNPPRPLYLYESTAYVSALSGKRVYLEDEVNLDITGYDWRCRRESVEKFLVAESGEKQKFLRESNISYLYFIRGLEPKVDWEALGAEKIFETNEAEIYKVNN